MMIDEIATVASKRGTRTSAQMPGENTSGDSTSRCDQNNAWEKIASMTAAILTIVRATAPARRPCAPSPRQAYSPKVAGVYQPTRCRHHVLTQNQRIEAHADLHFRRPF